MKKIFFILATVLFLLSCEKVLDDYDLPYERKLVVQAIIKNNGIQPEFYITLTQPPLGEVVQEKIDPLKLEGYVESDGEIWELQHKIISDFYQTYEF
jgi:hypothetical protein